MKIVCCIDTFRIGGGAQTQLAGLAVMLKKFGHDVIAVSYHQNPDEQSYRSLLTESGVPYICLVTTNPFSKVRLAYRVFKCENPDSVIAFIDGATMISCIIKLFTPLAFKLIVSERATTQRLTIKKLIKFYLYKKADWIVPNSYTEKNFIETRFPFLKERTITISNFVDTDHFLPIFERDYGGEINILVVARIHEGKNVTGFIDAVSVCAKLGIRINVDWYGYAFYPEYKAKNENLIRELNMSQSFKFHDPIKEISSVYRNPKYNAFCLPSFCEGCPNTMAEAMSCGLPVLCSEVSDVPFYIIDGVSGLLFNPEDKLSVINAIKRFSNMGQVERVTMAKNARKVVIEKMSKDVFVKEYLKILDK